MKKNLKISIVILLLMGMKYSGLNAQNGDWFIKPNMDIVKPDSANVGIGTNQPTEKLHISGNLKVEGLKGEGERLLLADPSGKIITGPSLLSSSTLIKGNNQAAGPGIPGGGTTAGGCQGGISWSSVGSTASGFPTSDIYKCPTSGKVLIGTDIVQSHYKKLTVIGQGLIENTGASASYTFFRTDGKAANMIVGSNGSAFQYDDSGFFEILSNTRENVVNAVGGGSQSIPRIKINTDGSVWINGEVDISGEVRISEKVGINTNNPTTKLQVHNGVIKISGGNNQDVANEAARFVIDTQESYAHEFIQCRNNLYGKVFLVRGDGTVFAREINVQATIPDFVFDKNYDLMSLNELENYIKENKHLPGIPSEQEVKDAGSLPLGKMQSKLLQKIEELTLYAIQQQKEIEILNKDNEDIKTRLEKIEEKFLNKYDNASFSNGLIICLAIVLLVSGRNYFRSQKN